MWEKQLLVRIEHADLGGPPDEKTPVEGQKLAGSEPAN